MRGEGKEKGEVQEREEGVRREKDGRESFVSICE